MNNVDKIPVTIISGFLGAGKTTFINFLLKRFSTTKFALVENEFGEVDIDSQLIKGMDASQMFELKDGCICCTITDEFELILKELHEKFPTLEHLVIETTGIADPTAVIRPFMRDEELKEIYQYNGTICLIDALNFEEYPEKEISGKQIRVADLLLLSKSEMLDSSGLNKLRKELTQLNPFAIIQTVNYGKVENIDLMAINIPGKYAVSSEQREVPASKLLSRTIFFENPPEKEKFLFWLEYSLDIYAKEIYRVKGIIYLKDEPFEYVIQGVGGSFEIEEGNLVIDQQPGKLVFIGKLEGVDLQFA